MYVLLRRLYKRNSMLKRNQFYTRNADVGVPRRARNYETGYSWTITNSLLVI